MTEPARPEPFYIADDRALDFLNSVSSPWGTPIEWLENGRDLVIWLEKAELLPSDVAMHYSAEFSAKELDKVAKQARELREWLREFVQAHAGKLLGRDILKDLQQVNDLLKTDDAYRQIVLQGTTGDNLSLHWQRQRRWHRPEDLLLPLAEAIGELVCHADFSRVRNCEGPTCTLWFHDVSKNHTRRWCTMSVCGNRAKAAAHRAKKRA